MVAVRPVEPPRRQVRRALLLLGELEDELRVLASSTVPRRAHVRSLVAARRRVWLVMAALGSPSRDTFRSWAGLRRLPRKRAALGSVPFQAAALVARAVAFLLRWVWRFLRAVVRLLYTVRAIWP